MNIEFFNLESEVMRVDESGECSKFTQNDTELISSILEHIQAYYPNAYAALCAIYERSKPNLPYFRYLIAKRFAKCNFGAIDNIPDIEDGKFNLECVACPLRGECKHEGIICRPVFNHRLSDAEMRVLRLLYQQVSREEIASRLYLSIHTVNNHIRHAFTRLNLHSVADFMKWAAENNLFHEIF